MLTPQCYQNDILLKLKEWNNGLPPTARELFEEVKKISAEAMKTVEKYAKKDWDESVKRVVSAQSSLKDIILILNLINKVLISFFDFNFLAYNL